MLHAIYRHGSGSWQADQLRFGSLVGRIARTCSALRSSEIRKGRPRRKTIDRGNLT